MLEYILKSTFCLVLLLGFYHLILEKEKMHHFNRFFLLGSIVFSFMVPFFVITVPVETVTEPILLEQIKNNNILNVSKETSGIFGIQNSSYLFSIYILISGFLLYNLGRKINELLQKTRKNKKISYFSATVVLLKENILPHSFLQYIFINKTTYQSEILEQQILTHELAHVEQKHSLDVLFIEFLQILFWFNPIFKYYRKAIQLNHEFLADAAVINSHKNITEYQHLLVNKVAQQNNIYLASNLNYSLTKKRLLMMTTPSSKTKILIKKLAIIPLLICFTLAFSQKIDAQEKKTEVNEIQEIENGISKKGMKEYKRLFSKAKNSNNIYKRRDIKKMITLFEAMSDNQQKSVVDIRTIIPPLPKEKLLVELAEVEKRMEVEKLKKTKELIEIIEIKESKQLKKVREREKKKEIEEVRILEIKKEKELKKIQKIVSNLEFIKKMDKKGAVFKYNGKKISKNKAIRLLKKNKRLKISTLDSKYKKPVVHISDKPMIIED